MDTPVVAGCVVSAKLIGAIEAEQKEMGGKWEMMQVSPTKTSTVQAVTEDSLRQLQT